MTTIPKRLTVVRGDQLSDSRGDLELVRACGAGEVDALGVLFDRYEADVRRFLARLAGADLRDLDDLTQSVFLEILKASRGFRREAAVKTWIFSIAGNVVKHHARAEARRRLFTTLFSRQPLPEIAATDQLLMRRRQLQSLGEAIPLLPIELRVVFVMCDVEGVSGVDAAAALSIPQGTVWRRLHEARKRLRSAVEGRAP